MRKLPFLLLLAVISAIFISCSTTDDTEKYADWRSKNAAWLNEQMNKKNADGTPYYTKLVADWDKQAYILIKYFNDTKLTENNLSPFYTSTVDVKYIGRTYDDVAFDSSYLFTSPADSIYRSQVQDFIGGWAIALVNMHVGDSCELIVPYQSAYGTAGTTNINPYSNLKFNVKLVGVPGLVIPAK